jgi:CheY-like chemotaxis protein
MNGSRGNVLVVDDNDTVRLTLLRVLQSRGYQATGFGTGEEAIREVEERSFDVALCDIHLPGINGIQAALEIRRITPNCRVLLMSGNSGSSEYLEAALRAGHTFEVLNKPFDPPMLFAVLAGQPVPAS